MNGTRREDILGVRLAPDERALIKERAEQEGRTDSGLVRHIVLTQLRTSNELGVTLKDDRPVAQPAT